MPVYTQTENFYVILYISDGFQFHKLMLVKKYIRLRFSGGGDFAEQLQPRTSPRRVALSPVRESFPSHGSGISEDHFC